MILLVSVKTNDKRSQIVVMDDGERCVGLMEGIGANVEKGKKNKRLNY